jgi:hypothetical protein
MKKVATLSLAIVVLVSLSAFVNMNKKDRETAITSTLVAVEEYPVLNFDKKTHNFGTINEGDVVETTFEFTNTGNAPLVIVSMKGSCGCTVANDWPREPIGIGEKGNFTVQFNSKGKPNQQSKTVVIVANTEAGREAVKIVANVNPKKQLPVAITN